MLSAWIMDGYYANRLEYDFLKLEKYFKQIKEEKKEIET